MTENELILLLFSSPFILFGIFALLIDGSKLINKKNIEEDLGPCDSECGSDIEKMYKCVNGRKYAKRFWYDTGHTESMM